MHKTTKAKDAEPGAPKRLLDQEPEVIKRWVRLKTTRMAKGLARRIARPRLAFQERRRRRSLEAAFDAVKEQAIALEGSRFRANQIFMNAALFFLLAERDIAAVKLDALTHPDPWVRSVALRTILLTIHEWDITKVTGKQFHQAMEDAGIPEQLSTEVTNSLRIIRKTQERVRKALRDLRKTTFAHRDADALVQYRAIRNLDSDEILSLAGEFYDACERFVAVMPRLIAAGGSFPGLFRQYVNSDRSVRG